MARGKTSSRPRVKFKTVKPLKEMKHIHQSMSKRYLTGFEALGNFGLSHNLIDAVIKGDLRAAKKLGSMANEGTQIITKMDEIVRQCTETIRGHEAYNVGLKNINVQAMQSDVAIKNAAIEMAKASKTRDHALTENAARWKYDQIYLNNKHDNTMELMRVNSYMSWFMSQVGHRQALEKIYTKPQLAQLDEDIRWNLEATLHMLKYGDNANLDLLPKKDYTTLDESELNRGRTIFETVQEVARPAYAFVRNILRGL